MNELSQTYLSLWMTATAVGVALMGFGAVAGNPRSIAEGYAIRFLIENAAWMSLLAASAILIHIAPINWEHLSTNVTGVLNKIARGIPNSLRLTARWQLALNELVGLNLLAIVLILWELVLNITHVLHAVIRGEGPGLPMRFVLLYFFPNLFVAYVLIYNISKPELWTVLLSVSMFGFNCAGQLYALAKWRMREFLR